jgi:uncharacterized protein YvpB
VSAALKAPEIREAAEKPSDAGQSRFPLGLSGRPRRNLAALLIVASLAAIAGTAIPLSAGTAHDLQLRADRLVTRWNEMVVDGVPGSDLTALRGELKAATASRAFGSGTGLWLPGAGSTVAAWESRTEAIWEENLRSSRTAAAAADNQLHAALAPEPSIQRKERREAILIATTPAELNSLSALWDLTSRLVPIDRRIGGEFAVITGLIARAAVLGVVGDPAGDVLVDARFYAQSDLLTRLSHAEQLTRTIARLEVDLGARLTAAAATKKMLTRASAQINLAVMYGMSVSSYVASYSAGKRRYAAALTVDEFTSVVGDLGQTVAAIQKQINILRSQTHIVRGVAMYYQAHALSCEETATSMALTHQGIYLSQDQILAAVGADLRPQYRDHHGVLRWGNPYSTFVGSVNGIENVTGLQTNYPPLVRVARNHGARVIAYGWMPAEAIYARLTAGHPVVVWATWDWAWHPRHDYLSFDGRWIPFIGPAQSHVYTAVGVRPGAVLVNDPIRGQYWVSKQSFEAGYSDFREAIVFA